MAGLLDGLTVLDLSWGMAGPFAGMLLADSGANVIKVEPPGGDPFRFMPAYHVWNRGKRSVILDLKTEAGRARFFALCATVDILLESFQPDGMENLGLCYRSLHRRFPRLIVTSITGYGSKGSRRDRPGYEHLIDTWLGLANQVGCYRPGPAFNAFPIASHGAAMLAVIGALSAVRARDANGTGQHVEVSLVDGVFILGTMQWQWMENPGPQLVDLTSLEKTLPRRILNTMGVLACGDGRYLFLTSGLPGRFAAALRVMGIEDQITPAAPSVEKNTPLSEQERSFLLREIPRILKTRPRAEWIAAFEAEDICCLPVDPPGTAFQDPQAIFDGVIATVDDPELGRIRMVGPALKCSEAPPRIARPAPRAGEHTEEVLQELLQRRLPAAETEMETAADPGRRIAHPLQGFRIVDFGSYYAGPAASKMLSDLGADVIKIEPLSGDVLRGTPPAFRPAQRGKRAIAVDMKTPEGLAIVQRLVAQADAVTNNMRPGAAERLGIGYEDLCRIRPGLIYLYSPGFGSSGPRAQLPAFAPLVSAMCGLQFQAAGRDNPPVSFWISNEDLTSGCLGAIWLLMGIHHQRKHGRSLQLEGSLFNAALLCAGEVMLDEQNRPLFQFEIDRQQTGYNALCRLYQASDAWLMLVVMLEREWQALLRVPGLEALTSDARFADRAARQKNDAALADRLSAWFAARSGAAALAALEAQGVPCELSGPNRTEQYLLDDGNVRSGKVAEHLHPEYGRLREVGQGIEFSDTPGMVRGPSPMLGEHTVEILLELGYDRQGIDALRERGIVTWKDVPATQAGAGSRGGRSPSSVTSVS